MTQLNCPSHTADQVSYQLLVESVKDYAIFMLDPIGHIISWNQGATRIKGYAAEEIIGQHFSRFYPPEEIQSGKPDRELSISVKEGKYEEEGWRHRKDGSRFWASVVITPLFNGDGQLTGFAKVTRDLTERKRHEEALKEANARLHEQVEERTAQLFAEKELAQATLHSTGDAVITVNANGFIEYLNPVAEQLTGWTTREAQDYAIVDVLKIVDATTRLAVINPLEQALQEDRIVELANNAILLAKDGREIEIEDSASPIHSQKGQLIGAVMVFHDVTRRKTAERVLAQNEKTFRATFENAPLGLCHIALDGTVLMANQALADMLGYSMRELYGLTPQDVVHPDDIPEDVEGARQLLSGETMVFRREKRHIRKDRSICCSIVSSTLMRNQRGEPAYFIAAVEDITARKDVEHTLKDYAGQFATLFDLAPVGILHTALDGSLIQVNQAFCRMTGYAKEELAHLTFEDISHPDDSALHQQGYQQLLSGETQTISLDKRYIRKDGAIVWAHITVTLKRETETNAPEYFIAIAEDITERTQTVEALLEREQQFRATFEQAAVGVAHVGMNGRWLRVNQKLCDILGYTAKELTARTYQDVTHPDDKEVGPRYLKQLDQGKADTEVIEKRYIRKDGHTAWVKIASSPVRDDSGKPLYLITFIEDITGRKHTEQALRESEERYRVTYEHAPVGIAHTDLTGRWQSANDRFCQILGYPREELLTMAFSEITDPEDTKMQLAYLQKLVSGELDTYSMEKRYIRKNGTVVWTNLTVSVICDCDGRPERCIVVVEDISARKRAEEALLESEEQFRAIFENAAEGIAQVGLDGKWLRVNPALGRILGYPRQELLELTFQEITDPKDLVTSMKQFRQLLTGEIPSYSMEKRYIRKNRTRVWVDLTVSLARGRDGKPKYAVSMIEDISRRKQAEEAMRRAEEHFRLLVEGTEDYAIILLDPYGNISSWNPGAEKILGYREDEVIGQHFSIFYTSEDIERGEPQRKLSRAIREGRAEEDR